MRNNDVKNGHSEIDLGLIVAALNKGGVVVLPTDTVYGLHGRADSLKAIKKIIRIKQRSSELGFVHLMSSYCMVHDHALVSKRQDQYLRRLWPASTRALQDPGVKFNKRPTTVILKSRDTLPALGRGGRDSLAVRLPKHELLLKIIKKLKIPLVSSSLNISGQKPLALNQIKSSFSLQPDLVVNVGKLAKKQASRLLDVQNIDRIKIIRK